jgi:hypothetical protein
MRAPRFPRQLQVEGCSSDGSHTIYLDSGSLSVGFRRWQQPYKVGASAPSVTEVQEDQLQEQVFQWNI